MDIKVDLLQWFTNFFNKKSLDGAATLVQPETLVCEINLLVKMKIHQTKN